MRTVWFEDGAVRLVDQTRLPDQVQVISCATPEEVAGAIRALQVRGAPAIGVTAAYGMALAASRAATVPPATSASVQTALDEAARTLVAARPTAVNLRWAVERMLAVARRFAAETPSGLAERLRREAEAVAAEDIAANQEIGRLGAALIGAGERVLTYCHTGGLATAGFGTAFGILRAAHEAGKGIR